MQGHVTNGNLFATLPGNAAFAIHAETSKGEIRNDFAEQRDRDETIKTVNAFIGRAPNASLFLETKRGDIRILEAKP